MSSFSLSHFFFLPIIYKQSLSTRGANSEGAPGAALAVEASLGFTALRSQGEESRLPMEAAIKHDNHLGQEERRCWQVGLHKEDPRARQLGAWGAEADET